MTSDSDMPDARTLDRIEAEAVDWLIRQRGDMSERDWLDFTAWLERDPLHGEAYDRMVEADLDLEAIAISGGLQAANEDESDDEVIGTPLSRRGWFAGAGMAAAALILGILFWPADAGPDWERHQTLAGETKTIELDGGITIAMNGGTRLELDRDEGPLVRLAAGEASFSIRSDRPSSLRVEAGTLSMTDRGTVFDVIQDDAGTRVAVAEGAVLIDPAGKGAQVALTAGEAFAFDRATGVGRRSAVAATGVTGWQHGALQYSDAALATVARDLARNIGAPVELEQNLAGRRFTGTIRLRDDPVETMSETAGLIGATATRTDGRWRLSAE